MAIGRARWLAVSSAFCRCCRIAGRSGFLSVLVLTALAIGSAAADTQGDLSAFTARYCTSCHNKEDKEGGLDLTALKFAPDDAASFATWVKVHDRVEKGEMPPKENPRPKAADVDPFVKTLTASLNAAERERVTREGRATQRRLNRSEYENALRDLLSAPWLQVQGQLPQDGEAYGFNKVSQSLDVSHVHVARYMSAADYALRQAMSVEFVRPETATKRYYAREDGGLARFSQNPFTTIPDRIKYPVLGTEPQPEVRRGKAPATVGEADPQTREKEAVAWMASNYEGFNTGWSGFRAPVTGRYRLRFSGYTVWFGGGGTIMKYANSQDRVGVAKEPQWFRPNGDIISAGRRGEPIGVYSRGGLQNRRLGGFDITTEPTVSQLDDVWMLAGESIVTDAVRFFRSRPRPTDPVEDTRNPLAVEDGMPGVAFRWMEVDGPLYDDSAGAGYRLLFDSLPMKKLENGQAGIEFEVVSQGAGEGRGGGGGRRGRGNSQVTVEVVSAEPMRDAERLLRNFMQRAYRRPVKEEDVQTFLGVIKSQMEAGHGFAESMLSGYTAVLASPEFVCVKENAGRLDDNALATRLALFLWNSTPDETLRARAARGELKDRAVLRAETERMLADPKSQRLVEAFLDYWLDLRKIDDSTPSSTLYVDYELDDSLVEAAMEETRLYFAEMLSRDLPARTVVDADFTYLNDRLARHYGIDGVNGIAMRRVALPEGSPRGGFMTQASILKVTANGTTTSPVVRGKWIMERILGYEIPPPPGSVPAVDPDIRGAVTIRQQLDKHRADAACAYCHAQIDPAGFALESFDVLGGWRDRYRAHSPDAEPVKGLGKSGWPFEFHYALPVDSAGELPDGRAFTSVRDFKRLLLKDEPQIARNLTKQLAIYATGAPILFSDRDQIERIVQEAGPGGYGVRTLVHGIVQSDLFLNK